MGGFLLFRVGFRAWRTFCWMKRWLIRMMCGFLGFRSWDFQVFRTLGLEILGLGDCGFCGFGVLALDSVLWFPDLLWFVVSFRFVLVFVDLVCGFWFTKSWFLVLEVWLFVVAYGCFIFLGVGISLRVGFGWICLDLFVCFPVPYVWIMLEWLRSFPYFVAVVYFDELSGFRKTQIFCGYPSRFLPAFCCLPFSDTLYNKTTPRHIYE